MGTTVVVIDHDTNRDAAELRRVVSALQKQICSHFSPVWGVDCVVRLATSEAPLSPTDWQLGLYSSPDVEGALGYHFTTPQGLPLMKVFPLLDEQDGSHWSVTASHEIMETLADPYLARAAQDPYGVFHSYEVADAVEDTTYEIDGVKVSNFIYPAFFEPPSDLTGVQLDYLKVVTDPYQILPGGYDQTWDGARWNMAFGPSVSEAKKARKSKEGRMAARTAKHQKATE